MIDKAYAITDEINKTDLNKRLLEIKNEIKNNNE